MNRLPPGFAEVVVVILGPVDIQRDHSMKLAPELKGQSPISPSMMLTIWSQRTLKSYNFPRSNSLGIPISEFGGMAAPGGGVNCSGVKDPALS